MVPDSYAFFEEFYNNLTTSNPVFAELFQQTDMDRQIKMLMQSITHITSFSATLEATEELIRLARLHGGDKLDLPAEYYDYWLECLLETVREKDSAFDEHVEKAWRLVMTPGIEYMKSYCTR